MLVSLLVAEKAGVRGLSIANDKQPRNEVDPVVPEEPAKK
jgi:hypothetical protein